MSADEEIHYSSMPKKRKCHQVNPSIPIPLSTMQRWQKNRIKSDENDGSEESNDNFMAVDTELREIVPQVEELHENDEEDIISDNNDSTDSIDCDSLSNGNSDEYDISTNDFSNNEIDLNAINDEIESGHENDNIGNNTGDNVYDNDYNSNNFTEPKRLYENSDITVHEAVFNLLNFYMRNNSTKNGLQQSLEMQIQILPKVNNMPKTLFYLLQYVKQRAPPCKIIRHYYCKQCLLYMGSELRHLFCSSCNTTNIRNAFFFFEFDLIDQIKFLFENDNLAEKLMSPKKNSNINKIISDITDSEEYIRVNSRESRTKFDLTLILNTDGLSLAKSSKSHCWPLMFSIAELPVHLRESHIIMLGLWYDNTCKPPMNLFLEPFCLNLKKCYDEGINWFHAPSKTNFITKVVAPLIVADPPARAEILHIKSFNSRYGCNICEIEAEQCAKVKGRKPQLVYKFQSTIQLRTEKRMLAQAAQVLSPNIQQSTNDHVTGIKGYTIISCLPFLDTSTCIIPEFMHSVLLGVVKQMIKVWFEKKGPWNINDKKSEIDNYITSIRPPHTFSRLPRPLSQHKFYKALEFYNFMLFYSLPTLENHLPTALFQHWILLVVGIFNLLKQEITENNLHQSAKLLQLFVKQIETLYNDRELTYNVHQLLHLVVCVKRWGPLWATSAFPFENYNGYIAKSVHGNKHFGQEIVNNVNIARRVQVLKNRINDRKNWIRTHCQSSKYELLSLLQPNVQLYDNEPQLLISEGVNVKDLQYYSRARVNTEIFTSEQYKETKTNSYTVQVNINDNNSIYGSIRFFLNTRIKFISCAVV